jgi:DNA-binding SARP family transcriptional activator
MQIRLLGPVEIRAADGTSLPLPGAQRRAVLALLALELGERLPVERFFELLWGERPPVQARAALQGHVAALRKVLDRRAFDLATTPGGYRLDGEPDAVDVLLGQALLTRAASLDDDAAAALTLQQVLGLWRGPALVDLPDTDLRLQLALQLDNRRTQALTAWAERRLRLGTGSEVIPHLEQAVRSDALREPLVALLMRCLQQARRHTDALMAYHDAQARLRSELGVGPGPLLQRALQQVLEDRAADQSPTAPTARPGFAVGGLWRRQIPREPVGFVGRAEELRRLDRECGPQRSGGGLAVVVGPAGVGKTAAVVHWAHRAAAGFPDGQLFADLRGYDPQGPAAPAEALGRFLLALGLPESEVPEDPGARAALYQEHTRGRRLLVVLDNVRAAEDVHDLLSADPGCSTVITSRHSLERLVAAEGAAMLRLDALPADEARELLAQQLPAGRVEAEPEAAARLVALCDRLPLALRIAAARLAARPDRTLADMVAELDDERTRLGVLDTRGVESIRTALAQTCRQLTREAQDLLALLAVHPGTVLDCAAAAALLEADLATARQILRALAAHHLLTESAPDQYHRHELVRLYGRELLERQGGEAARRAEARLREHRPG